jgi:Replication initiator protein A
VSGGTVSVLRMESTGDRLAAVKDPQIAELGRRGQAAAASAAAVALAVVEPEPAELTQSPQDGLEDLEPIASTPGRLRAPQRAALETNLSRRGFWLTVAGGPRQLTLFEQADRLGVYTVEPGPRGALTVLELEVATWLCSRWREFDDVKIRRVPLALSQLAADFGWPTGGSHLRRLGLALDRLTHTAITSQLWAPGESQPRTRQTFHLLDRWQAGRADAPGQLREYGWAELGSWLLEQLRAEHLTYLDWPTLRRLERPAAKRLYVFLEAERFVRDPFARRVGGGWEKSWPVGPELLATVGITHATARKARATLAGAAAEVRAEVSRYPEADVVSRSSGRGYVLVATRVHAS